MTLEAPEAVGWKLKKETLPPGYLSFADWRAANSKKSPRHALHQSFYMAFLFDAKDGLYGNRPGNPWRVSRRKWIERFIKIQDKQTGEIVAFKLNETQRLFEAKILRLERAGVPVRFAILKARQHGISTQIAAIKLFQDISVPNTRGLMMGHKKASAEVIHGRFSGMVREIRHADGSPWPLALVANSTECVRFDMPFNSSTLVDSAESADYRGDTLRFFHAIEPAEWPKADVKANAVLKCIPKAAGTYSFIEGTARGETGWFAETWKAAWRRERDGEVDLGGTIALFYPWFIHEKYRYSTVYGAPLPAQIRKGIDGTLSDEERSLLGRTYLRRGVGYVSIDHDQLAWRRMCIQDECQGQVEFFHQEYPSCLVGETRVSTDRGIVRIDEVDHLCRETETGRIVAFGPQPDADLWTLTTECGRAITGTADHPVKFLAGGFAWLSELKPGDEIQLSPPRFAAQPHAVTWNGIPGVTHSIGITPEWARFLGYFMGDGSWCKDTISVVCDAKDARAQEDVSLLLSSLIGTPGVRRIARVQGRKGAVELRVSRIEAREPLHQLGCLGTNGSGGWRRRVCVPEAIWRSPRPIVREFLRGLFESDGWAREQGVGIGFSKLDMIREVQLLLLGFGINARFTSSKKSSGNGGEYEFHRIDLAKEESRRFVQEIGFVSDRKRAFRFERKVGRGSAERGARPMADRAVRVEKTGYGKTYDLTIDDSHVFGANGILTHNTPEEAFLSSGLRFFNAVTISEFREGFARAPAWRGDTIDPEGEAKMMMSLSDIEAR